MPLKLQEIIIISLTLIPHEKSLENQYGLDCDTNTRTSTLEHRYGWLARTKRNASIDIERVWRGYLGRQRAQAERDRYLFSKSQSVGIEFGRQMLMEHKMHATKLQSEIALLLKQKADTEEEVEKLLYVMLFDRSSHESYIRSTDTHTHTGTRCPGSRRTCLISRMRCTNFQRLKWKQKLD